MFFAGYHISAHAFQKKEPRLREVTELPSGQKVNDPNKHQLSKVSDSVTKCGEKLQSGEGVWGSIFAS